MLEFHDIQQNTDPWYAMRCGRCTGSNFATVMANLGKPFGDPAKKYAVNIAIEQITGNAISSGYTNAHMQRGHEQEPLARMAYEDEYFCDVTNGGFFCDKIVGVSPDGMVDDDGVIEIKSVIPSVHYEYIRKGGIPSAYKWQVDGNLMFTGREWIDFISYCADFPEDKQLYVHRVWAKDRKEEFEAMKSRISDFTALITEVKQTIEMEQ